MTQKGLDQGDLDLLFHTIICDAVGVVVTGAMIRPGTLGRVTTTPHR